MSETKNSKTAKRISGFSSVISFLVMALALVVGIIIYDKIFGDPANFIDGELRGEPKENNLYGVIYKGGFIVPGLVAINIIILIFSLERMITLLVANGKGNTRKFIVAIKASLASGNYDEAIQACDKKKGSLANVVRAGVEKYRHVAGDSSLDKEQKIEAVKKELDEATALELPMLSKNLTVLSTCASIATLVGLIGTVLGMIRSFAAMSSGSPDTAALATGISEALINTAFGITASTVAIIMYNVFSTQIDAMTYSMDEANFIISQDLSTKN